MTGSHSLLGHLVEMVEHDPRLRTLPVAARMLWLALTRKMQLAGLSTLRLGPVVPKAAEIALLVGCTDTELQTHLKPILERGLLLREADGVLASPLLAEHFARVRTPANGGMSAARRQRPSVHAVLQQREMLLPIANAVAVGKTQSKPKALGGVDVDSVTFHRIGRAVLDVMGVDPASSGIHYGVVRQWLADGASEALIMGVVAAKARPGLSSPGYFSKAIQEALQQPADPQDRGARSMAFDAALQAWRESGKVGPMPAPAWFDATGARVMA